MLHSGPLQRLGDVLCPSTSTGVMTAARRSRSSRGSATRPSTDVRGVRWAPAQGAPSGRDPFKGSGFYTTDYGRLRPAHRRRGCRVGTRVVLSSSSSGESSSGGDGPAKSATASRQLRRRQVQGEAEGDLTRRRVSAVERPTDEALRKAQTTLRGLVSDGPVATALAQRHRRHDPPRARRQQKVAILYVSLRRYGRLEHIFGWQIVNDILDAVAANLRAWSAAPCGASM